MNKRESKFVKRLIGSYSLLFVVILIMGVYLYAISIENVSTKMKAENLFVLEKTVHDMDTSFKTMDVLAGQVVNNSNITRLANSPDNSENVFYLMAYYAKEDLTDFLPTQTLLPISNYYIYLEQPGYILSMTQFSDTELYFSGIRNYYRDKYEDWLKVLDTTEDYRKFIPVDPYKNYSDSTYLYTLPLDEYSLKNVPAVMCFEIDYEALKAIFDELNFYDTGYLMVTDADDRPLFNLKGANAENLLSAELRALDYQQGIAYTKSENVRMMVTQTNSSYNNWHYYLIQPEDDVLYSLLQYRNIFFIVIAIGLLLEIIMIFVMSRSNINKITQMGNELMDTRMKQEDLQALIDTQKPIIMDTYVSKILGGHINTAEELDYAQQYLNISLEGRKFSVLYLVAYINQYELHVDNSAVTGPDNEDYMTVIRDAISHYFRGVKGIINNGEKEFAILLSCDMTESDELATMTLKEVFKDFHNYLLEEHAIYTLAGVGDWHEGLTIAWRSYQQAMQTVSYATKKQTFRSYSSLEKDNTSFYYPNELSLQLSNFITAGNQQQVLEIFEIIRHENMEARSLPIQMMTFLLSDIRNSLYKIRFAMKVTPEQQEAIDAIDQLFKEHMSLKLFEDLALAMCQLFNNSSTGNQLIVTIRSYIDENFSDPSLCLSKISDEFSISESYFSYLFKEEIGENFSSYLERRRMDKALELIASTQMNVTDIYLEVGYNNAHTFRRAFKKLFGKSPKEVRIQNKNIQ